MLGSLLRSFAKHSFASLSSSLAPLAAEQAVKPARVVVAMLKDAIERKRVAHDVMYADLTEDDIALLKRVVTFTQAIMEPDVDPAYPPSRGEVSLRTLVAAAKAFGREQSKSSPPMTVQQVVDDLAASQKP